MNLEQIVEQLDQEIRKLQEARSALTGIKTTAPLNGRRGRRQMSAAARARISAAQKKRWALQKAGKK